MSLILMYITNKPITARIAENSGVDWIFIDLEIIGKEDRQGHLDTVISRHSLEDVRNVKNVLTKSRLLVRINPINSASDLEIDKAIENGADILMLPYFKTVQEVRTFISVVNRRVQTCLLLETPEAVNILDDILEVEGIDNIHIGLNDLHLGYKLNFMFELLSNGVVDKIINKISRTNIQYGFGGVANLGGGAIPAEIIIDEHYRLNSSMVILSRSFIKPEHYSDIENLEIAFKREVNRLRHYENKVKDCDSNYFKSKHDLLKFKVNSLLNTYKG